MKLVNLKAEAPLEAVADILEKAAKPSDNIKYDEHRGKPTMLPKRRGKRFSVSCRFIGGNTEDNGHILGTFFIGSLTQKGGSTRLRGVIMTAPHFHIPWIALVIYFLYRLIAEGLFSPIPIILTVFVIFMFKTEYSKQSLIKRYLKRAFGIASKMSEEGRI